MRYFWLMPLLAVAGCNNEIYVRDGVTDGDTFYLAPVALNDTDPALQSWVAYSLTRSVCQLEITADNPARANSYECELKARTMLVESWAEERARDTATSNRYLDELLAVHDAGYLAEYTASYFLRNEWRVPTEVDLDGFDRWRRQNLRRHKPQTRIIGYWAYKDRVADSSRP